MKKTFQGKGEIKTMEEFEDSVIMGESEIMGESQIMGESEMGESVYGMSEMAESELG